MKLLAVAVLLTGSSAMGVEIVPHENKVTKEQIATLEKAIGAPIPEDYYQFLVSHNGGRPKCDENKFGYVSFPVSWKGQKWAGRYGEVLLDVLYSADEKAVISWRGAYESHVQDRRIPKDTFPIGSDPGSNQLLVGISGDNRGKVFFWAAKFAPADDDVEPTYENIGLVADSFSEFIGKLHPWKE
jgi:hypothetical protein